MIYPFLTDEDRSMFKDNGVIVIGSKTEWQQGLNCKDYLRLYLNNKFNFDLKEGMLSLYLKLGIKQRRIRPLKFREDPSVEYIAIYTSFKPEELISRKVSIADSFITHVGMVVGNKVLSKYNHWNLLIHDADSKFILDSFTEGSVEHVFFVEVEEFREYLLEMGVMSDKRLSR